MLGVCQSFSHKFILRDIKTGIHESKFDMVVDSVKRISFHDRLDIVLIQMIDHREIFNNTQ